MMRGELGVEDGNSQVFVLRLGYYHIQCLILFVYLDFIHHEQTIGSFQGDNDGAEANGG